MMNEPGTALPALDMLDTPKLEQLVDRAALLDVCQSFFDSFGLPVRVVSRDGHELAKVTAEGESGLLLMGGREREQPIVYDGRVLGQLVVGPEPFADRRNHLDQLTAHFARVLDALLFSGHRALLASTMHLATAESNYRELAEKTANLQQAFDKLKELDRLKSTFLATMSHELRTPLTSIIGYSEMLSSGMGGELNPTQREFVDTVRAKGDQLLELILTLLDVAKLEQDSVRLAIAPIDAGALTSDVVRTVSPGAAKKNIQLEHRIEARLPALPADKTRLRQVLVNLLDNAVKFTPRGGTVSLEVGLSERASSPDAGSPGMVLLGTPRRVMQFVVRDNGIGIAHEERERVFDAFYQVDGSATREYGGTGLGLSIVKRLVEAHGGTVELDSTPGQGSEFRVRIPLPE
ncbi:MAG: Osmosensitive channel histidine kinase KdpD [Myxococcaceae bacterium]|nr:Osmosensitive channel histidine kinase KdpD [Myxococcaceae bacterium]